MILAEKDVTSNTDSIFWIRGVPLAMFLIKFPTGISCMPMRFSLH